MSLRLLPAFITDNDDDDDGNFTKWMSSYWGHGAESGHSRDRKRSFRRPARARADRRASLPTVSQLDAMKLSKLHAATMAGSGGYIKPREEKADVRLHQRARRSSSDDNSRTKTTALENRITTIPELTESFEKRLRVRDKRTTSVNNDDRLCLICHEDMRKNGGVQELHCAHRFHKEAAGRLDQCRPRSGNKAAACQVNERRLSDERRKSADGPISLEEQPSLCRQLSLRRHR